MRHSCIVVVRMYIFNHLMALKKRSLTAFVEGRTKMSLKRVITSPITARSFSDRPRMKHLNPLMHSSDLLGMWLAVSQDAVEAFDNQSHCYKTCRQTHTLLEYSHYGQCSAGVVR